MKKYLALFALIGCAFSISSAKAQEPVSSAKALATIDPQARDLLARLSARYKRFNTFQSVVDLRGEENGVPQISFHSRVQLDAPFRAVVTVANPKKGVQRSIFDGQTVLATDSKFPRRFTKRKLNAEHYDLRLFLRQAGAEGIAVGLLSDDDLASALLEPDLRSVALGLSETLDKKTLQNVIFTLEGQRGKLTLSLLIDPKTLILHRVRGTDTSAGTDKTFVFTENYSEIQFDEPLAHELFSTVAPRGYRAIESFETNTAVTSIPVETIVK